MEYVETLGDVVEFADEFCMHMMFELSGSRILNLVP
jgi:hypothetical protein